MITISEMLDVRTCSSFSLRAKTISGRVQVQAMVRSKGDRVELGGSDKLSDRIKFKV